MRKLFVLFGVVTALSAGSAYGNDPSQEPHDWSGPYLGVQLGYGWAKSDFTDAAYNGGFSIYPVLNWSARSDGLLAGLQAGYNIQDGSTVFGIEGELGYLNLDGSRMQPGEDPLGVPYDAAGTIDGGPYAALNVRLGHAIDKTLIYAKVGAVYSTARVGFLDTCTTAPCGDGMIDGSEKVGWGYQLGAGVEHALTNHWTIKAEYTYLDFGDATITATQVGGGGAGSVFHTDSDLSAHKFSIGLNYRF